jgi:competence protein ComEA
MRWRRCAAALAWLLASSVHAASTEVNSATLAQLESVSGVGPALAQRMLDARERGAFTDWRDLQARVAGVGAGSAAKLSAAGLLVNGQPFVAAPAAASKPRRAAP